MMIYVVAFNYQDAHNWAHHQEKLSPNEWKYVVDKWALMGLRQPTVALVSRWYMRKDVEELEALLRMVDAVNYEG